MRRVVIGLVLAGLVAPAGAMAGAVKLRITAVDGAGGERVAALRCDSEGPRATGFLRNRDAARLCARAYALERFLSTAPDAGRPCTQVYGGPERARVRGSVRGSSVDRRFARTDGCEIADWDRARWLLPRVSARAAAARACAGAGAAPGRGSPGGRS